MTFKAELKLGKMLGQGHFGDVHEGQDPLHGRVAIKVLRQMPKESEDAWRARKDDLMTEAQHLKNAEHANVVRVLNLLRHDVDDKLHMVTEFCDGGSALTDYDAGPISIDRVRKMITDVSLGLECIHGRGMIHRDIKPGNILCSGNTWKVSDFGLVTDDLINGYAAAAGYSDHIAPEVWDRHLTSVKSDVWALGMTVYRLLNGHAFYSEHFIKRGRDLPEEIRQGRFALKLPWLQHVPKAWKSFVRRAMNDDTDQRFQNIHDLAQALGQLSITPAWKCMFTPKKTVWTREKNNRQWEVQWVTHSVRKHTWSAISRGGKRDKVLGLSKCQVSRSQLDSELIEFFQKAR